MPSFKKFSLVQDAPRKIMGLFKASDDKSRVAATGDKAAARPDKAPAKVAPTHKS